MLLASAACLGAGTVFLAGRVPLAITAGAVVAVGFLVFLYFASKKSRLGQTVAVVYCIVLIAGSAGAKAHDIALLGILTSPYMFVLDMLQILGFYAFPVLYIISTTVGEFRARRSSGALTTDT